MIELNEHPEGCVLAVRAQPGARRSGIVGEQNGARKIAVNAPPDRGRANKALQAVLADALGLKKSQVELLAGPTNRDKRFLLRGVGLAKVRAWLNSVAAV